MFADVLNTSLWSSNGNIFRVTGRLWGESTGDRKGQWCGDLIISLILTWTNGWANNRDVGDLSRHHAHYDVAVMKYDPLIQFLITWDTMYQIYTAHWYGFQRFGFQKFKILLTSFIYVSGWVKCPNQGLLMIIHWLWNWKQFRIDRGKLFGLGLNFGELWPTSLQTSDATRCCGKPNKVQLISTWTEWPPFRQTTFSNAFSWMKKFDFWLKFHGSLFLRVQLTIT